jgi:hypothetical protein
MTQHQLACKEARGTLILVPMPSQNYWNKMLESYTPGCGSPTHVTGTNGGVMPCGAMLTEFGKTRQYLCAACDRQSERMTTAPQMPGFAKTVNAVGIRSSAGFERPVQNLNEIKALAILNIKCEILLT